MNYIKRLQLEAKENLLKQAEVNEIISELYAYMQSKKFNCGDELDGYINVDDVKRYLDRMRGC